MSEAAARMSGSMSGFQLSESMLTSSTPAIRRVNGSQMGVPAQANGVSA